MFHLSSCSDADREVAASIDAIVQSSPSGLQGREHLPCELDPCLFLGGLEEARDVAKLKSKGITHVLNMAGGPDFDGERAARPQDSGLVHLDLPAEDHRTYPLFERHFDACRAFYNGCSDASGKMLIHCQAGINRSGAMAIALLVGQGAPARSLLECVRHVHSARGTVCSNRGFQVQLAKFVRERRLEPCEAAL